MVKVTHETYLVYIVVGEPENQARSKWALFVLFKIDVDGMYDVD